ncbi:heptaprenyl diphosphate synthase component 1 [Bacillus pinisoli]|uniref:heptaprenyl diphosphate synthase component 1 n=1 Tax=Bacillus pinisoli TaxID=2901866 RepID=UPI001FF41ADA
MSDINSKSSYMLDKINQYIHHSYLIKYLEPPTIDEDKLFLLIAMCQDMDLDDTLEAYIISTMLVQIALDIHEEVSVEKKLQSIQQTEQQLKVLAGDYYSGLYYSLLSKVDAVTMIKSIATCIKRINEHKIRVYRQDPSYSDSITESLRIIESELFINMAETYQLTNWKTVISEVLLLKRINREKERYVKTGFSVITGDFSTNHSSMDEVLEQFDRLAQHTQDRIQTILSTSTFTAEVISGVQSIVNRFNRPVHHIVEEG